ncbi:DUF1833 domain-containing protein [Ancylobacter mangrovi]|uniref:DUF1833 domain-containing protein n=1 Tax=Ancylobacter mangrovi TaxID=2972472 RepID=UPI0021610D67|nr:DUF1833 domain-containing protein [Ancylobacter mangrovi]MCS0501375.1 DUF1833 domain-containing protein [Ancylobacter mangrovi]
MPDPFTQAWEEAEAACPTAVLVYATLELQHPAFVDGSGAAIPLRLVHDLMDRSLGIELSALFDPGTMATFTASAFESDRAEFGEGRVPECSLVMDNVGRDLTPWIEAAVAYRADLVMIYREYRSDDVDEPCYGPVEFRLRQVKISGSRVEGTARLADIANMKFPRKVYSRSAFPGLQA